MRDFAQPALALPDQAAPARPLALTFTGTGAGYFQIWIVDVLLTIVTLGIYSAWARVHRLKYFTEHTHLDGVAFAFHGHPVIVLKGRLVLAALLAGYWYAGENVAGKMAVLVAVLVVLPPLLRGALRFRLDNTRWRGQRFGFNGSVRAAYLAFIPPILACLGMLPGLAALVVWPLLHANIKRYRHAHVSCGSKAVDYALPARRVWRPYLPVYAIGAALLACAGWTALSFMDEALSMRRSWSGDSSVIVAVYGVALLVILATMAVVPFVQARTGNLAWSHTRFPGVTIGAGMSFGSLFRLHAVNLLLMILTLGLFYPFAAVRAHRYKLAHLHVTATEDLRGPAPQSWSVGVYPARASPLDAPPTGFAL